MRQSEQKSNRDLILIEILLFKSVNTSQMSSKFTWVINSGFKVKFDWFDQFYSGQIGFSMLAYMSVLY